MSYRRDTSSKNFEPSGPTSRWEWITTRFRLYRRCYPNRAAAAVLLLFLAVLALSTVMSGLVTVAVWGLIEGCTYWGSVLAGGVWCHLGLAVFALGVFVTRQILECDDLY